MNESSDGARISRIRIVLLCLPAAAVQMGWTVGEGLIIPYLLSLGVSNAMANAAFLLNPLIGLILQPMLGSMSDTCRSAFGRRRPFLLAFHIGAVIGLIGVISAENVVDAIGLSATDSSRSNASVPLIAAIFLGFALVDCCDDLILMPARALLNDILDDDAIADGNSLFALVSSVGSCIGLSMVVAPLETLWPLTLLRLPIRATFAVAAVLMTLSALVSVVAASGVDKPAPAKSEDAAGDEDEETSDESTLSSFYHLVAMLPRPLIVLWICQVVWWYAALHVNVWWTSYMAVNIFGASAESDGTDRFAVGVRYGTAGLLLQSAFSFIGNPLMSRMNAAIGVTNYYHLCAIVYASASVAVCFVPSFYYSLPIMIAQGLALPPLYSSPFVLIEVHAADADDDDDDGEGAKTDEHNQLDIGQQSSGHHAQSEKNIISASASSSPSAPLLDELDDDRFTTAVLDEWRGVLTALFNVAMICAQIVVGVSSGFIIDRFGDIRVVFSLSGGALFIVTAAVAFLGLSKPAGEARHIADTERRRVSMYGAWKRAAPKRMKRSRSAPALVLSSRTPTARTHRLPVYGAKGGRGFGLSRTGRDAVALERIRERARLFGIEQRRRKHRGRVVEHINAALPPSLPPPPPSSAGRVETEPRLYEEAHESFYQSEPAIRDEQLRLVGERRDEAQDDEARDDVLEEIPQFPRLKSLRGVRYSQSMSILPTADMLIQADSGT